MGWEDPLEKGKATHSSILAWRIPRTVWSRGSERVRHHGVTFTFIFSTSRLNRYCTIIYMLCIIYSYLRELIAYKEILDPYSEKSHKSQTREFISLTSLKTKH